MLISTLKGVSMGVSIKCYLSLSDAEDIYKYLTGSSKGLSAFRNEAKNIAIKCGRYQFREEEKLFELFQAYLPEILERKNINNFGELMQYLPDDIISFS